jgi:hypothetical protein
VSWNLTDLALDEDRGLIVELIVAVQGTSAFEVSEIEFLDTGVVLAYELTTGTAPDPVVTTRYVMLVPWSNIRAIRQSWAV